MPAARVCSAFKSMQQLCSEELDAISKAFEIMPSSSVQGHAEAHVPAFVKRGRALASLRAGVQSRVQSSAAEFLARRGREMCSCGGVERRHRQDGGED